MDFSYFGSYKRRWVVSKISYANRKSETYGLSEFVRFLDHPQMWQFADLGLRTQSFCTTESDVYRYENNFNEQRYSRSFAVIAMEMADKGPTFRVSSSLSYSEIYGFAISGLAHQRKLRIWNFQINHKKKYRL
jgi:hypothetical protein